MAFFRKTDDKDISDNEFTDEEYTEYDDNRLRQEYKFIWITLFRYY